MKYIIDTHAFIWYATGDSKLSNLALEIIESNSERYISIASLWEMAIKINIGKLKFNEKFDKIINEQIRINDYKILPVTKSHLFKLSNLELPHRDPFDRIIICQALFENMSIVSVDEKFKNYKSLNIVW